VLVSFGPKAPLPREFFDCDLDQSFHWFGGKLLWRIVGLERGFVIVSLPAFSTGTELLRRQDFRIRLKPKSRWLRDPPQAIYFISGLEVLRISQTFLKRY
jgi:hypothetical protein